MTTNIPPTSKSYPGAASPTPPKRIITGWFAPWRRGFSTWGFVLNRLAGIGLVVYLYLHLIVLSTLLGGEAGWNQFVAIAKMPLFLMLDVVLLAGILGHGLNGLRVALVGTGLLVRWQRQLFYGLMALALVLLVVGGALIFLK